LPDCITRRVIVRCASPVLEACMNARFERFTERARTALQMAQGEARVFNHNYIGTEHLLLGLIGEGVGKAALVLVDLGVDLHRARTALQYIVGRGDRMVVGEIGLTPRAKRVIELAVEEANRLDHEHIGTEHLLLGLLREGEGIAIGMLESMGVPPKKVNAQLMQEVKQAFIPESYTDDRVWLYPTVRLVRTLFDYSFWARDRLLTALVGLDEAKLREVPDRGAYGSIHDTLAHMAASEYMWIKRCMGDPNIVVPKGEDFKTLDSLVRWWDAAHLATMTFLQPEHYMEGEMQKEVTYTGPDGVKRTRKIWHMLMQISNHQTEHRGQLGTLLGQMGVEVPPMDLVVYLSEQAAGRKEER
jgi:uncharacterized damage-inducible protein DinB